MTGLPDGIQPSRFKSKVRLSRPLFRVTMWIGLALTALGIGMGASVSVLEENDLFCASCHMVPERTYYNRAVLAREGVRPVADLASAHYLAESDDLPHGVEFRCIDCHRGDEGLPHRAVAIALGARDALVYVLGVPDQMTEKAEVSVPVLLTESCLKCHTDTLLVVGFPNHFHNKLPAAYQAWRSGGTLTLPEEDSIRYQPALVRGLDDLDVELFCLDCHQAHVQTPGAEETGFINLETVVYPACEECHTEILGSPLGLALTGD